MWIAAEEITGDTDDDHGADPRHGIAAGDGEAKCLGENYEDHCVLGVEFRSV